MLDDKLRSISSQELIAMAYEVQDDDKYWLYIGELRRRGSQEEFDLAVSFIGSTDSLKREIGAQILGQLGWDKDSFHEESVDILISLLNDDSDDVIEVSAYGLGYRNNKKAVPHLMKLVDHVSCDVRLGIVIGLSGHDDDLAVSALIQFSEDPNEDVRNWTIFGLGQQCEMDSPEIRDVFIKNLCEKNPEIRGEAMIGLAMRKDVRVNPAIIRELQGEFHGTWVVEAVEEYPDSQYIPLLERVRKQQVGDAPDYMIRCIDDAIDACRKC